MFEGMRCPISIGKNSRYLSLRLCGCFPLSLSLSMMGDQNRRKVSCHGGRDQYKRERAPSNEPRNQRNRHAGFPSVLLRRRNIYCFPATPCCCCEVRCQDTACRITDSTYYERVDTNKHRNSHCRRSEIETFKCRCCRYSTGDVRSDGSMAAHYRLQSSLAPALASTNLNYSMGPMIIKSYFG